MIRCAKLVVPAINKQQVRTATILKRVNTPPILKKGSDVSGRITQEDLDRNAIPQFWDGPSEEFRPDRNGVAALCLGESGNSNGR